jgi:3-(3-hydroxy-phenyl)propionate hydroxylase
VGCDGARSTVRAAIGAAFEGAAYPETTVLATTRFPFEQAFEGLSGVNYIWKDGGTFSLLRLPDVWRCSFIARPGEEGDAAAEDAALARHVAEILPERAEEVAILDRRPYRVHARLADRWRRGRLLIAGDAAHLNAPKGGMGLNGGVHDAFELADHLAAVYAGADLATLDRYERRRRPVVAEEIIAQADANRARMAVTDAAARRAELARLQAIAADPGRARAFLSKSSMLDGLARAKAAA